MYNSLKTSIIEGKTYESLKDKDIINNKYDLGTLEWNIRHEFLSLRMLVYYQTLTPYICAKYVVFGGKDEKYADCSEDAWISTSDILEYQPHITIDEMHEAYIIVREEDEMEELSKK